MTDSAGAGEGAPTDAAAIAGPVGADAEPYQSLYRRYRPQRFADVLGQGHVTRALRNAVRDGRVAHAYLFSGPRGTGKTSTARILAMALNCADPQDGEPDGVCDSCRAIRSGASVDVHELDAASNRRLDEMRELLSRVALGTSGRQKVYIVDEVHQLTGDASSALLKTLEEPPAHVVFVLATTDPQRVLPTIRSRTQHYEFRLLGSDTLSGLLSDVNDRAGLGLPQEALDLVVRRGRGSARDALSVLDQVAAAGAVEDETSAVADIVDAIAERDAGRVLLAVAEALGAGRDPRRLVVDLLEHLRNGFLASQSRSLVLLADEAAEAAEAQANRLGLPSLVRAIEELGRAAVDMRDSVDTRVTLEAALVRLASPAADTSPAALAARIDRLEAALAAGGSPASSAATAVAAAPASVPPVPERPPSLEGPAPSAFVPPAAPPERPAPAASGPPERPAPSGRPASSAAPADGSGGPPPRQAPARPEAGSELRRPPPRPAPGPPGPPPKAPSGPPPGPHPSDRGTIGAMRGQRGRPAPTPGPVVGRADGPGARRPTSGGGSAAPGGGVPAPPGGARQGAAPEGRPEPGAADRPLPTRDELTEAWGDRVLAGLSNPVRPYFSQGRFVDVTGGRAVFALPDQGLLSRAQNKVAEAEAALEAAFGRRVPLRLVLDDGAVPPAPERAPDGPEDIDGYDLTDLTDAGPPVVSPEQRLLQAFPGAEEVEP